jgi:alanine transaminase
MPLSFNINKNVVEMEYAVRGPIPRRALEMKREGRKIIACNIGNPQSLGQKPLTFFRQVLSLVEYPELIAQERKRKNEGGDNLIPVSVLDVAEDILIKMETGMGAYTESKGPLFIREAIAAYIDKRDGSSAVPANPENIFLTNGASEGANSIIEMLITSKDDGIMVPMPQYPLYSATIRKHDGVQVNYYPDEDNGWTLAKSELERSYAEAKNSGVNVRCVVVINPSNPTGAILDEQSIADVVDFAEHHDLAIIADEVYQDNLYGGEFISFAKEIGEREIALFSLHSTSKGFCGECGHRGGYLEVRNVPRVLGTDSDMGDILLKQASVSLCSNTAGQILTYLLVSPPEEGSEAYEQFIGEKEGILEDLHDKAVMIKAAFKEMDGVECFGRLGAMYLFPRLNKLPAGKTDFDYCMALLEETGLCTVNGSGFGQKEGTSHLRIAFLPSKDMLNEVLPAWIAFHNRYVAG